MSSAATILRAFLALLWIGTSFCSAAQCVDIPNRDVSMELRLETAVGSTGEGHCELHCPSRATAFVKATDTVKDMRVAVPTPAPAAVVSIFAFQADPRGPPVPLASLGRPVGLRHLSTVRLLI